VPSGSACQPMQPPVTMVVAHRSAPRLLCLRIMVSPAPNGGGPLPAAPNRPPPRQAPSLLPSPSWFIWSSDLLYLFDGWNVDSFLPCFRQMDYYPYATLGADRWFCCDGLHRLSFPNLLWDVLHRFGYTEIPACCDCPYYQFMLGRCKVHMDIPTHRTDPTMTA
jgi:hypothetical protein